MNEDQSFRIAFWILFGALVVIRVISSIRVRQSEERLLPDRKAIKHEGKAIFILRVMGFLCLMAFLIEYALNASWMVKISISFPRWLRWSGFFVGLASLALLAWTQTTLGKEWSPQLQMRQDHRLVKSGPYARVRHPLYTAIMAFGIGIALVMANWAFAIFTMASIVGLVARIPKEERMMIQRFGEEYKEYIKRTGKFSPKFTR